MQLRQNLGALEVKLTDAPIAASHRTPTYPDWHQRDFDERSPKPTRW